MPRCMFKSVVRIGVHLLFLTLYTESCLYQIDKTHGLRRQNNSAYFELTPFLSHFCIFDCFVTAKCTHEMIQLDEHLAYSIKILSILCPDTTK